MRCACHERVDNICQVSNFQHGGTGFVLHKFFFYKCSAIVVHQVCFSGEKVNDKD